MQKRLWSWINNREGLILVVLLSLVLRIPSLFEPYWYGDEGIYLVLGQALKKGLVWYRDIHDNKPPLLYLLAAISGTVFYFRLLLTAWFGITVIIFFQFAKRLFPKTKMAWYVATLAMISLTTLNEGNIANAEIFMILPTVLGMWLVYINKNLLLAGVSLSLAFLLKAPAGFDWAAAMIWLTIFKHDGFQLVRSLKAGWWKLLGGFVFLIALTIGYYGFVGGLEPYVRSALLQNIGYLTSWQTGSHSASGFASPGGLLWRVIILLSLLCGLFLIGLRYKIVSSFKLIVVWFLMALFGALLSERPYPHYLIQPAVPGSLLLSYFLFSQKKLVKIIIVSLGLVTTIAYRQINFWRYPLISYYKNFLKLVTGQQSQESYRNYFDPRTEQTYQLADYLLKTTMPYERVFIWGDEPTIYALSNRLPIGRYTVAYHVLDFNGYQETISAWDQSPPTVVLVMDYETRPFPEMKTRLAADYVLVTKIGQASIYRSL